MDSAFSSSNITTVLIGQNDGLPNIKASILSHNNSFNGGSGAFSVRSVSALAPSGDVLGLFGNEAIFDASKSNKIYGRSDNITTRNLSVKYWKRIS